MIGTIELPMTKDSDKETIEAQELPMADGSDEETIEAPSSTTS